MRVGAYSPMMCPPLPVTRYNPALVGCDVGSSTIVDAEGDEWEMVDRLSVTEAMIPRSMYGRKALETVSDHDAAAARIGTAARGERTLADGTVGVFVVLLLLFFLGGWLGS